MKPNCGVAYQPIVMNNKYSIELYHKTTILYTVRRRVYCKHESEIIVVKGAQRMNWVTIFSKKAKMLLVWEQICIVIMEASFCHNFCLGINVRKTLSLSCLLSVDCIIMEKHGSAFYRKWQSNEHFLILRSRSSSWVNSNFWQQNYCLLQYL